jgi:hypothetical protein
MAGSGSCPPSQPSSPNPRAPATVMIENRRFWMIVYTETACNGQAATQWCAMVPLVTTTPPSGPGGAAATGVPVRTPLATLLDRHQYQLISVARRQFMMEAFTKELDRVARGQEFRIVNDVTWLMLLDTRDVMVIHPAALHDMPNKRVRNCGMADITEESKPRLLALSPRSAILPR